MQFLKRHRNLFWMLLGAILVSLPCLFPSLGILQWVAMIPFFIGFFRFFDADEPPRYRKAYLWGFLALYLYNFILYHWFVGLYPMDFAGLNPSEAVAVIAAGWLGLPLFQAIPGGGLFVFYAFLKRRGVFKRAPILSAFVFPALWVVWEWYSTLFWWGVPWSRLCLGQSELLPVLQNASLLGPYFISFLILSVNALLAYAILHHRRALVCSVTATSILVATFSVGGGLLLKGRAALEEKETLRIAVVQGNISSHEKWESSTGETMLKRHADLTRQAVKDGAEVVLWAETALPYVLNESVGLMNYVSSLARECKVPLIVGALYKDSEGNEYNALYYVEPDGKIRENIYAKRHLVPFGEYVPMRELITFLIPPLEDVSLLEDDLVAGDSDELFETEWGSLGSLICFDSIYETLTRDSVLAGAELLLLSTNDSWFRDSAAVYMHQAQARLRAVESGRWVVRSANTGISSITSPMGENVAWIDPLTDGYAVAEVTLDDTMTPYMTVGNLFVLLAGLFLTVLFLFALCPKWQNVFSKDKERQNLC